MSLGPDLLSISNGQLDCSIWEFSSLLESVSTYSKRPCLPSSDTPNLPSSVLINSAPGYPAIQRRNVGLTPEASFSLIIHVQSDTNVFHSLPDYFLALSLFPTIATTFVQVLIISYSYHRKSHLLLPRALLAPSIPFPM